MMKGALLLKCTNGTIDINKTSRIVDVHNSFLTLRELSQILPKHLDVPA
jgi:hypothetical protein